MILRDRRFRQGSHAWPDTQGLAGSFAEFWKRSVISKEGPSHKADRRIVLDALHEDYVLSIAPAFSDIATQLAGNLPKGTPIEFVSAFSEPFAGQAIATLLDLPAFDAPEIAKHASALGLAMGIGSKQYETVFNAACTRLTDLAGDLLDKAQSPESSENFVSRLWNAAKCTGMTDRQTLLDLIVISIFGGVDTTRAQLAFAVAQFIEHPTQWQALRSDPSLADLAVDEIIRTYPTTTWSTREAIDDITLSGVTIARGETVHIFTHATATDPRIEPDNSFSITHRRKRHFGFGGGAHHCLGQFVARTDMACALRVMAATWQKLDWGGTPEWLPDSGNTSPKSLPVILR